MFVESAVPAARRNRSTDAKTSGNLATLLGGEVNVLSVHRTSLPLSIRSFPVFGAVSRDFPAFPGRLSVVLLTSSRRPSISTTSRGGCWPTLDAEEAYALFACAAFPVRKRLVSASRSMDDEDGEDEDDVFSSGADVPTLLGSRSVSPHSSKPH